ncbi:AAA family protein [Cyclospora cayetanensis]|uniref:AAA family protein n=1 Tax=Cyclospora cayetanensis TaxID=88456 RepID=A0A1D3D4F8_9EIME|nr:AAA family protein [Cyclospora cayetanensis]
MGVVLYSVAELESPSLIFIDEIDSLLGKRREREDDTSIRMKNQLLQMMDGLSSSSTSTIIVVGATNRPDMLDEAAVRRLTRRVLVPLPDVETRAAIIRQVLDSQTPGGCRLLPEELESLSEKLSNWSGADIRALCASAADRGYDEAIQQFGGIDKIPSRNAFRPISHADFLEALKHVRPSASCTDAQLAEWMEAHGAL